MNEYIAPLERLIDQFQTLPGIGRKTAVRLAFSVLNFSEAQTQNFAQALLDAKNGIKECVCCHNISDDEYCSICKDSTRDASVLCVVEDAKSVMAIERMREFKGRYHVLKGVLSPIDGIGPDQLTIASLCERVKDGTVKEVILATNPTVDGETTAMYLTKLLKAYPVKVTRLAYGIPVGGDLEYADTVTLLRAMEGRREI